MNQAYQEMSMQGNDGAPDIHVPIILLYGHEEINMLSVAATSDTNTLCLDFVGDAKRSPFLPQEIIPFTQFEDVLNAFTSGAINNARENFSTFIIHGVDEMLTDYMIPAIRRNFPHTQEPPMGNFSSQGDWEAAAKMANMELYRLIAETWGNMFNTLIQSGYCIVLTTGVCKERQEYANPFVKYIPCVTGSKVLQTIVRKADLIGYCYINSNGYAELTFDGSPSWSAKNRLDVKPFLIYEQSISELSPTMLWDHIVKPCVTGKRPSEAGHTKSIPEIITHFEKQIFEANDSIELEDIEGQIYQTGLPAVVDALKASISGKKQLLSTSVMSSAPATTAPSEVPNEPAQLPKPEAAPEQQTAKDKSIIVTRMQRKLEACNNPNQLAGVITEIVKLPQNLVDFLGIDIAAAKRRLGVQDAKPVEEAVEAAPEAPEAPKATAEEVEAIKGLEANVNKLGGAFGATVEGVEAGSNENTPEYIQKAVQAVVDAACYVERNEAITFATIQTWVNVPVMRENFNINPEMVNAFTGGQWTDIINHANIKLGEIVGKELVQMSTIEKAAMTAADATEEAPY